MISDNTSLISKEWRPEQGWLGVVPGQTSIKDAIDRLGGICETAEMANGFSFDFRDGLIRVTSPQQQGTISKLWISGVLAEQGIIPGSLKYAKSMFPNLHFVRHDSTNAEIYESPGIRLAASTGNEDADVMWIEFFPVES
jgi:hypothetical protein